MLLPPAPILYEDNHLLVVNKLNGQLVQGDKTGNVPLSDLLKEFIKQRDHKPGNVFLGVVHRLDRPVSGVCLFAKTGKALARLNEAFRSRETEKTYRAVVEKTPQEPSAQLINWLKKNESLNKSRVVPEGTANALEAILEYKVLQTAGNYSLLEIKLQTGRHHQIRVQLANIGCPIAGDTKYGARAIKQGNIALHAHSLKINHPVRQEPLTLIACPPNIEPWPKFAAGMR